MAIRENAAINRLTTREEIASFRENLNVREKAIFQERESLRRQLEDTGRNRQSRRQIRDKIQGFSPELQAIARNRGFLRERGKAIGRSEKSGRTATEEQQRAIETKQRFVSGERAEEALTKRREAQRSVLTIREAGTKKVFRGRIVNVNGRKIVLGARTVQDSEASLLVVTPSSRERGFSRIEQGFLTPNDLGLLNLATARTQIVAPPEATIATSSLFATGGNISQAPPRVFLPFEDAGKPFRLVEQPKKSRTKELEDFAKTQILRSGFFARRFGLETEREKSLAVSGGVAALGAGFGGLKGFVETGLTNPGELLASPVLIATDVKGSVAAAKANPFTTIGGVAGGLLVGRLLPPVIGKVTGKVAESKAFTVLSESRGRSVLFDRKGGFVEKSSVGTVRTGVGEFGLKVRGRETFGVLGEQGLLTSRQLDILERLDVLTGRPTTRGVVGEGFFDFEISKGGRLVKRGEGTTTVASSRIGRNVVGDIDVFVRKAEVGKSQVGEFGSIVPELKVGGEVISRGRSVGFQGKTPFSREFFISTRESKPPFVGAEVTLSEFLTRDITEAPFKAVVSRGRPTPEPILSTPREAASLGKGGSLLSVEQGGVVKGGLAAEKLVSKALGKVVSVQASRVVSRSFSRLPVLREQQQRGVHQQRSTLSSQLALGRLSSQEQGLKGVFGQGVVSSLARSVGRGSALSRLSLVETSPSSALRVSSALGVSQVPAVSSLPALLQTGVGRGGAAPPPLPFPVVPAVVPPFAFDLAFGGKPSKGSFLRRGGRKFSFAPDLTSILFERRGGSGKTPLGGFTGFERRLLPERVSVKKRKKKPQKRKKRPQKRKKPTKRRK